MNAGTLTVSARIDEWGGLTFQEFNLSPETPEEVMHLAKEYSMDNEAIAEAELNARRYNFNLPF